MPCNDSLDMLYRRLAATDHVRVPRTCLPTCFANAAVLCLVSSRGDDVSFIWKLLLLSRGRPCKKLIRDDVTGTMPCELLITFVAGDV